MLVTSMMTGLFPFEDFLKKFDLWKSRPMNQVGAARAANVTTTFVLQPADGVEFLVDAVREAVCM